MSFRTNQVSQQNRRSLAGPRAVLVLTLTALSLLMYSRVPDSNVLAASADLAATYHDGIVEVNVPYDAVSPNEGPVQVEILDSADKEVGKSRQPLVGSRSAGSWRFNVRVPPDSKVEDLAWDRLRITSGSTSKIVSLSEILRIPVVRIFGQRAYAAGSSAAIRIITSESKSASPLPDSRLKVELIEGDRSESLFSGRTDNLGTAQVKFSLPEGEFGARQLRVTANTSLGPVMATEPINIERRDRILLTTDKPIYQPGQTMHLRALTLDGPTRVAAANQPITLEIEDGKGNKVFKKRATTDKFGIASADFELADEVNFGPYHIRAILGDERAQATQEKTVKVDRYTLPKFKVEIGLAGDGKGTETGYYRPGDTVSGSVTARYLFGKPIAKGEVTVTFITFDVQQVELAKVSGKTDGDGKFEFSSKLPDFLAGRSTEQGNAPVSIAVSVKDTANHTEEKSRNVLVSKTPILIMAVPESGRLLSGLENKVYILTSYPDGAPAKTEITGDGTGSGLKTDEGGLATISLRGNMPTTLNLKAVDGQGRSAEATVKLESQTGEHSLMLRADKSVYKVGGTLRLETFSTRGKGAVYIDVIKDRQTLVTRAIESTNGRGTLSMSLTPDMFGALEVRAYQITPDAEPIVDRRLIYVDPADDLKVEVTADLQSYKPGEDACLHFRTTDQAGRPVSAALGIEIVDEAVFALSDKQPGFEKVFMNLEKELLTPRYEVHQFAIERVLRNDYDGDEPAQTAQREKAAAVLFAAAGTVADRDVQAEFGRETIEAKRPQYLQAYYGLVFLKAQQLAQEMTAYYSNRPASPEGFGKDLAAYVASSASARKAIEDPWGNPLSGEGQVSNVGYNYLTVRSYGPDGKQGTVDDIVIGVYAQRSATGRDASPAIYKGHMTIQRNAIAGGRASIEGVVVSKDGVPMGGVKVTARRTTTGRIRSVYTDPRGRFTLPDLSPDQYEVRFEGMSLKTSLYRSLTLNAGDRARFDGQLDQSAATPITLTAYANFGGRERMKGEFVLDGAAGADMAAAPMARAQAATADKKFKDEDRRDIPNKVQLANLVTLAPGVAAQPKEGEGTGGGGGDQPRVRSFFPETLYTNPALITDAQGTASIHVPMADSITTWRVTSLASTVRGAMGSANFPIRVFQDFFVDLDLPATVTEGDVISVPAAIYNYLPNPQRVSLDLRQDPWFTLEDDKAAKDVQVGAGEVTVAYFRVKASKIGQQQLQVTARLGDAAAGQAGDAVARSVDVMPNGQEKDVVINERLEGSVTRDLVIPDGAIPEASKILVKLYPGALSQVVEGLDSILRMPGGCFEQTSSSTYPDVLAMDYLKTSKKITPEVQAKAEGYISLGYQRLVTFEVPGGGFSWFGQAPANKILTSYGLMEFSDMSRIHEVDPRLIERTQNWLAGQQQPDGSFKPDTYFINEGATNRYNTDVLRITAYVGWSLATTGYKGPASDRAGSYCKSHATGKEDAYTLAVLANFAVDSGDKAWTETAIDALVRRVTEEQKVAYWKQDGETPTSARETSADLETTALAAQALLKSGQKSGLAKKALDYLTSKKDSFGNWQSTQATVLSLKAFLLSFSKGTSADTNGIVEVAIDGKPVQKIQITKDNNDLLQTVDLREYTHAGLQKVGLRFEGKGSMEYQIVGRYWMPWTVVDAPRDPLTIQVSYDRTRLAQNDTATAKVSVQNNTRAIAKMIMVDLGIPPGFEPSGEDFDDLMGASKARTGGRLEKYTITARQVILYFNSLNPNQRIEFSYRLRAKFPVRAKTFSSRVYEYYNPEVENKTQPVEMSVTAK